MKQHLSHAENHKELGKLADGGSKAVTATDDLDTILAAYRPQESVDTILAKLEPAATRVTGFAQDLDAMDAILAKLSGVAA